MESQFPLGVPSRLEIAEQLLLTRLLVPAKKPPSPAVWSREVSGLFRHALVPSQWNELFGEARGNCVERGWVQEKPLAITTAGRDAWLAFWRVSAGELPKTLAWRNLLREIIVPRVLGVSPKVLRGKDAAGSLRIAVLKQRLGLPEELRTASDVLNALAWRVLGIESTAPFKPAQVVARLRLETERTLGTHDVLKHLVGGELIASEKDVFRAVVQRWIVDTVQAGDSVNSGDSANRSNTCNTDVAVSNGSPVDTHAAAIGEEAGLGELERFATRVTEVASRCESGRFGASKVFISHVWRRWLEEGAGRELLAEFKQQLIEAHRRRLVTLSRADLVERMDPRDVAESEASYLDARFHFIRL
jgi:hypothetical protein